MKKLAVIVPILIFFAMAVVYGPGLLQKESSSAEPKVVTSEDADSGSLVLEDYPEDAVPFYKLSDMLSFKYFVNDDPLNYESFFDRNKNYYNVVFRSESGAEEVLAHYRSLMDSVNEESTTESRVEGVIRNHKVSVTNYTIDSPSVTYLQVYKPTEQYAKENPFFEKYPQELFTIAPEWTEHESSYGKLAQNDGEEEYTQYFTLADTDKMQQFFEEYSEMYKDKDEFRSDEVEELRWSDQGYDIVMTFSKDHGRVYLMIRKPMNS